MPGSAPPGNCCSGFCSSKRLKNEANALRSRIANPRCKSSFKGAGSRLPSIVWQEKAGPIIRRLFRLKSGLTAGALRQVCGAARKKSSERRAEGPWKHTKQHEGKAKKNDRR